MDVDEGGSEGGSEGGASDGDFDSDSDSASEGEDAVRAWYNSLFGCDDDGDAPGQSCQVVLLSGAPNRKKSSDGVGGRRLISIVREGEYSVMPTQ
jgi:hypothetical protein